MKVYISGKISDNPNYMEQFSEAEIKLSAKGYNVINPAKVGAETIFDYADFMITSLLLLKKCDSIYFLSNWEDSIGSQIEKAVAKKLGLKIMHEKYFGRHRNKKSFAR